MSFEIKTLAKVCLGLLLLPTTIAASACGASAPPVSVLEYGQGFFAQEALPDGGRYRWMGPQGVVFLKNEPHDMVLTIRATVPVDHLAVAPVIRVEWNGGLLEEVNAADWPAEKRINIPAASQRTGDRSELRIQTSQSFVPKEANPPSQDGRRLGLVVYEIRWETK
jgi:hypothetical protein